MPKKTYLDGKIFGKLKVIRELPEKTKHNKVLWECRCECGNIIKVPTGSLNNGNSKSCGKCPLNTYIERDGYMVGLTSKGEEFYFDIEDYDKVKDYNWHIRYGYVLSNFNGRMLRMHRFILDLTDRHLEVDHIFGIKHDNRKSQLRIAKHIQNSRNVLKQQRNTSSKYKGVTWSKFNGKWQAQIGFNKNHKHIGYYKTEIEAAQAYNAKAVFYFGEFARLNELKEVV